MIREQVNRFKDRRSFKEIIPPRTRLNTIVRYEFAQSPVYNSRLIISKQNIDLLSLCKKSGSWVSIKFFKNKISIWTSKNLRYFKKIEPSLIRTRNFGVGVITSAEIIKLDNVCVSSEPTQSSLNIYNHKINKSETFEIEDAFYLCVNGADQFQHFIQDFLPILTFVHDFLADNAKIPLIIKKPLSNFQSHERLFEILEIENSKLIIDYSDINVKNLYILNFEPFNAIYCLPKELYSLMFNLINQRKKYIEAATKNLVVFIREENTRNFSNQNFLIQEFSMRAKLLNLNPVFLNPSKSDLDSIISVLSNAKYVFGMHGGAIYNMIFAAPESTLIEFITTEATDSLCHMIRSFGINYMPYAITSGKNSHEIEVTKKDLDNVFESLFMLEH
jgi:hypothetical protein